MKSELLLIAGIGVGVLTGWLIWGNRPTPPMAAVPPTGYVAMQVLRETREKVLQDNPSLAAEYKALLKEQEDQQKALNDAIIEADPKTAPILAKLEKLHLHVYPELPR
jgi:hypothetical protein